MDGAAFCRVQPLRAAIFPAKAATEFTDGIEIALEVGKRKIACRVVESFFAGFAGPTDRKDARLDRFTSIQAIVAADFEQAQISLAVVEVPFECSRHSHDACRAQHVRFFRKRIRKTRGRNTVWTEQRVALFGNVRNGHDFAVPESDEPLAQTRFRFVMRKARRALACGRQTGRKFVEAVNARDFFDQIDFAFDFGAPGRLRTFPGREKRAFRATVLVDSNGGEAERAEAAFHLLVRDVRTHDPQNFGARDTDFFRGALAGININYAGKQFAAGKLQNQFRCAARGQLGHFRIGAATETRGGFGVQFQKTGGTTNSDRFEPRALYQDIFS